MSACTVQTQKGQTLPETDSSDPHRQSCLALLTLAPSLLTPAASLPATLPLLLES